ncbi:TRAP transport system permease component [Amycolatopsis mediterranei S699]|uniref:TRAP transport system permease component n=2 Tax=Amycolatopsis mediterranei TaxID=33910 RepID=A0A0H3CZA7_AMYMU|nr:TRAP transporter fused permease subunit [Amycolatopsis mediterranei]ADJ43977.1 TRAP transport system permease component [Amycolatopsis mediterranei U32]AEK40705.1 TRAP transport system permease component [Amycolatopsis mediterranei S699]AFO75690.1 TRAP transport system permease component [Amycolatopsis mediterranei S699]AGT82819.1 TRAP transport system permease component [Amycolatopsis mediterranei RB]KDO06594.1 C4-dicarboxylate ABC transporter permease [Amycolatopsis mediterranei]
MTPYRWRVTTEPVDRDSPAEIAAEHDEERPARKLSGVPDRVVYFVALAVAVLVLKQVFFPFAKGNQFYLVLFLGVTLPLVFLCYRPRLRGRDDPGRTDWVLAVVALAAGLYPVLVGYDGFLDRQGILSPLDIVAGALLLVLILEATRRTTGLVLPIVCLLFLAYAYYGGFLPQSWGIAHAGVDFSQIVNALFNDASGFYGTPLDVAASYIVLFTLYGAVLNASGAGKFFVDISFAAFRRSRTAPGRTTVLSGFLLGTVSGSGTATAVSLGSITWPILQKARYPKENAGGLLAASGIGAILSPPTLGAAAFIIAEYLQTSYLKVLVWATVPTLLYYLGIVFAMEADARRFKAEAVDVPHEDPWKLLRRGGYHFLSLAIIVVFLALDIPPFAAVVYATGVAALFALLARRHDVRGWAKDMVDALSAGVRGALPVIAVCAAAGVITSTITKTGLGLELADALVELAGALTDNGTLILILTVLLSAIAVGVLGLAVPVTASFIIAWVVIGPALETLGVADAERAMFIFYYAVLSEVTPPTALAAVASAAITGGSVLGTMWQCWKYTLPAFLVPIAFVLTDNGAALLLESDVLTVLWVTAVSALAVAALAVVTGGWLFGPVSLPVRLLFVPAALCLLYLEPVPIAIGAACGAAAVGTHAVIKRRTA